MFFLCVLLRTLDRSQNRPLCICGGPVVGHYLSRPPLARGLIRGNVVLDRAVCARVQVAHGTGG